LLSFATALPASETSSRRWTLEEMQWLIEIQDFTTFSDIAYDKLPLKDRNKYHQTLLHLACQKPEYIVFVHHLVSLQANPNLIDENGDTPLHIICRHQHMTAFIRRYLCTSKTLHHKNKQDQTPINISEIFKLQDAAQNLRENLEQMHRETLEYFRAYQEST
jgi:ankyrin repeat protein